MAHFHGRAFGVGIAVLALIGATSAYVFTPSSRSKSPASVARYASAEGQTRSGGQTRFGGLAQAGVPVAKLGAPPPPPPKCTFNGAPIACNTAQGWWDGVDNCYWNLVPTAQLPPAGAPGWMGNPATPGTLYHITCPANLSVNLPYTHVGLAIDTTAPPGYGGATGLVGQLQALQAVLNTNLLGPIVGSAPQSIGAAPNSVGLVGEPVWLWQYPNILTWGPLQAGLANIGAGNLLGVAIPGVGVGLDALGARIDYYMGDGPNGGTVITCNGLGTQFPPLAKTLPPGTSPLNTLLGALLSLLNPLFPQPTPPPPPPGTTVQPACSNQVGGPANFRYPKPGLYTVTAAATWNVNYALPLGVKGTISIVRYTTFQLRIDELQVVVQ